MIVEQTDPVALKRTLEGLPRVGEVAVFPCSAKGDPHPAVATHLLVRVTGDERFARFAMTEQKYARVCAAPWDAPRSLRTSPEGPIGGTVAGTPGNAS